MPASKAHKLHQLGELRAFTTSLRGLGVNASIVRTTKHRRSPTDALSGGRFGTVISHAAIW
jgi:hypothetical protein